MRDSSTLQSASLGYGGQMDRSTGRFLPAAMILALLVQLMGVLPLPAFTTPVEVGSSATALTAAQANSGDFDLPALFEANAGQLEDDVRFAMQSGAFDILLRDSGATIDLPGKDVALDLARAAPSTHVIGADPLTTKVNYLVGPRTEWTTGVSTFGAARYVDVYPGIAALFHAGADSFQYDFELAPGADPSQIGLRVRGARDLSIARSGDLIVTVENGKLRQSKPFAYQVIDGEVIEVPSAFTLTGSLVGFQLGDYDADQPLVIDPEVVYSTYLGGSREEHLGGFEVDDDGNAYIYGNTDSSDKGNDDTTVCDDSEDPVPTTNDAFQEDAPEDDGDESQCNDSDNDGDDESTFVAKFDPEGEAEYVTYLGGAGNDEAPGMPGRDLLGVDVTGQAVVAGTTSSMDFPTQNAYDDTCSNCFNGDNDDGDAFITKFTADGSDVLYSTYMGGDSDEGSFAVHVDVTGTAYVAGVTSSTDFPTSNAQQPTYAGGSSDVWVTRLNPNGSASFATYLGGVTGGQGDEIPLDIVGGPLGRTFVVGRTQSSDFPLQDAYDSSPNTGGICQSWQSCTNSGFVTAYDDDGDYAYSTYLSGDDCADADSTDCDSKVTQVEAMLDGSASVAGATKHNDFPTTSGAFDESCGNSEGQAGGVGTGLPQPDAFVGEFNPNGSGEWFSCYGGHNFEELEGLALSITGNAYIAGWTMSDPTATVTAFPLVNAWDSDPSIDDNDEMAPEAYLARFSNDGSELDFSTYLGGSGPDLGRAVDVDVSGTAFTTGVTIQENEEVCDPTCHPSTGGDNFPATEGTLPDGDEGDAFVAAIQPNGAPVYATYLGGDGPQEGLYIGATNDGSNDVVVAGHLGPPDEAPQDDGDPQDADAQSFPLRNAYDSQLQESWLINDDDDDRQNDEAFVTRLCVEEDCAPSIGGGGGGSSPDLDVSPESSENELPDDDEHTMNVSVSGFSDDPVDFKILAGPNDNTAGVDFSCDPDEDGDCSASYSSGGQTGTDQICAWIDSDDDNEYDANGTDQDGGDCEEESPAELESNDGTDVVLKNWVGTPSPNPRCSDNEDNDGDGLVDTADPGCTGPDDNSEGDPAASQCSDGVDNDRDGDVDNADRNCAGPNDDSEGPRRSPPARRCDIDKFPNYNVILGTDGPDTLRGTSGPDLICANSGMDNVFGKAGADVIFLGSGADEVLAGKGADLVRGGGGRDDMEGDKGKDELHGGDMGDVIRGDEGADSLWGHNGNDRLKGGPGDDDLHGGTGNFDECTGGDGSDTQQGCEASP